MCKNSQFGKKDKINTMKPGANRRHGLVWRRYADRYKRHRSRNGYPIRHRRSANTSSMASRRTDVRASRNVARHNENINRLRPQIPSPCRKHRIRNRNNDRPKRKPHRRNRFPQRRRSNRLLRTNLQRKSQAEHQVSFCSSIKSREFCLYFLKVKTTRQSPTQLRSIAE